MTTYTTIPRKRSVETRILKALEQSGEIRSLYQLALEIDATYRWSWITLQRLENSGRVVVDRRRGYPLVIRLVRHE